MRIAIPTANGRLAPHFGHCEKFSLMDVDLSTRSLVSSSEIAAPKHEPGVLPPWLKEQGVEVVIAGGMGSRAQSLFHAVSIEVLTGAPPETALVLVEQYLNGNLVRGENVCDH